VVTKLFNVVEPDVAVFGKKDYQQWRIIRRVARDLDFDVDVVGAPLAREPDGLAMSSRNVRLTDEHREKAIAISAALFDLSEKHARGDVADERGLEAAVATARARASKTRAASSITSRCASSTRSCPCARCPRLKRRCA
jgi:pantoate--beta-alanine ligase